MIAITRYRVPERETDGFAAQMTEVLDALSSSPGYRSGRLARTVDDPTLWALVTEWDGAGYYRRALGDYQVRLRFIPLAAMALDEPGAYEIMVARPRAVAGQQPEKKT